MARLRSIQLRLIITYLVLITFSTGVTYAFFLPRMRDYLDRRTQDHLVNESRVLGNLIANNYRYSDANLELVADDLRAQFHEVYGMRVRLYDPEGTLLEDSRLDKLPDSPAPLPVAGRDALVGQQVTWQEEGNASSEREVHVSSPLKAAGRVFGVVDISAPVRDREMVTDVRNLMGWALLASLLTSWAVALLLARTIVGPIGRLRNAADRMAGGDLAHRVRVGQDELGRLGQAMNHMAAELQRRIDEIVNQKNTMNTLLETLLDGVIALDRENRIRFLNRVAEAMLGTRAEDAIGQPLLAVSGGPAENGENEASLEPLLIECLETKQLVTHETLFRGRMVKFYFLPYEDDRRHHLGTMVVMHDVTDLRRLEEARSQFFGSVSHELRTPLTIIKGFASNQLDSEVVSRHEELRRSLEMIDRETDRLSRLVDDILELSRLRSRKMSMELRPLTADVLVRETLENMETHAARAGISLQACYAEQPTTIAADADRLKQILINLVDNAIKYTPVGGAVRVSTARHGQTWRVTIADTGNGIPAEEIPFLFEKFFRGRDTKRKGSSRGTGLGLAIVRELVDAHGANIAVESEVGKGSTVIVTFPVT